MRCRACDASLDGAPSFQGFDRFHGTPGEFNVICCPSCGSGLTFPPLAPTEIAEIYPTEYGAYQAAGSGAVRWISIAIRRYQSRRALTRHPWASLTNRAPSALIDVGCGRGDLAASLVRRGWRAVGVEPSPDACALARAQGVDAREGTLANVALEASSYAAAVFQHSLEHTEDPVGDLKRVYEALEPDGILMVTVPNFGSWQRRHFRDKWFHLDLPRHRVHFSPRGLARALERAGFEVQSVTTSTSILGLPATLQYAAIGRCLFPRGLPLRLAAGFCIAVLPLARIADSLGGGGDQLHALARRAVAADAP